MKEIPLHFGENRRLFGILTPADDSRREGSESRVFVLLNAGLLHRVGPYGLHVRLARELATIGFSSLRVDLAGLGDSLPRSRSTIEESVATDYADIVSILESQLGPVSIVLVGLCSGADNAIRLAPEDSRITGMVLLDPVCNKDDGFNARALRFRMRAMIRKCMTFSSFLPWRKRCIGALTKQGPSAEDPIDNMALRHLPSWEQTRTGFKAFREREGRVLSIFTRYALQYYNQAGQMGRVIDQDRYGEFSTELFWPDVGHTYPVESHRDRLIEAIKSWAVR